MTLDRATVLAGISHELRDCTELFSSLSADELTTPTRCAGWTARDVAGHVVGTVVDITEGRREGQGSRSATARQAQERAGHIGTRLADELANAAPTLVDVHRSLPADSWEGPAPSNPNLSLGFAVEAIWYDAFVHGDDIRAPSPEDRSGGWTAVRCPPQRRLSRAPRLEADDSPLSRYRKNRHRRGGAVTDGDPLDFVLAATGRIDPALIGLDSALNVYADEIDASDGTETCVVDDDRFRRARTLHTASESVLSAWLHHVCTLTGT